MSLSAALLLAVLTAATGYYVWRRDAGRRRVRANLARFRRAETPGTFEVARPRAYFGRRRPPHAVLLLHGFTGSAGAFKHLVPELERLGLPFYAPNMTGFGLDDTHLLEAARTSDWRRDAQQAYALLAELADEVSVVAFSYGALLACELAETHPVRHLVLIGPYHVLKSPQQRRLKAWTRHGLVAMLAQWLSPYVDKRRSGRESSNSDVRDPAAAETLFAYPSVPFPALLQMWRTRDSFDFKALRCQTLDLLWGVHDCTSDVEALVTRLEAQGAAFGAHPFAESGHNLLEDVDRERAIQTVTRIVAPEPAASAESA